MSVNVRYVNKKKKKTESSEYLTYKIFSLEMYIFIVFKIYRT